MVPHESLRDGYGAGSAEVISEFLPYAAKDGMTSVCPVVSPVFLECYNSVVESEFLLQNHGGNHARIAKQCSPAGTKVNVGGGGMWRHNNRCYPAGFP